MSSYDSIDMSTMSIYALATPIKNIGEFTRSEEIRFTQTGLDYIGSQEIGSDRVAMYQVKLELNRIIPKNLNALAKLQVYQTCRITFNVSCTLECFNIYLKGHILLQATQAERHADRQANKDKTHRNIETDKIKKRKEKIINK